MSTHAQIQDQIVAAGFVPGHRTTQVQYYTKGSERIQLFHPGMWKRQPERVELVTNFPVEGCQPRPDKWYQFPATNAQALQSLIAHISPPPPAANPLLAYPTEEELEVLAPAAL